MNIRNQKTRGSTPTPTLALFRFLKTLPKVIATFAQKAFAVEDNSETKKLHQSWCQGFTLLEMTVSLGLFTIIMFIATNSFLSVVDSDRKSRAVRIAADNLNIALEDMSRRIKTGSSYYCGAGGEALLSTNDCANGGVDSTLFLTDQSGQRVKFVLDSNSHTIRRSVGPEPLLQATSPEISINSLKFFVRGSTPGAPDNTQPTVIISIDGSLGTAKTGTTFKIQSTVTQRQYDN